MDPRDDARNRTAWQEVIHTSSVMWKKLNILFLKLISSNKSIVIVAILDLIIDIAFCILYITEFQVNVSTSSALSTSLRVPYWLQVNRPQALFRLAIAFSIWILCSFAIRVNYVRRSMILHRSL
jgi:hypothetical protein